MKYIIQKINNQSFKENIIILLGSMFIYVPLFTYVSKDNQNLQKYRTKSALFGFR
jgi:hypothetical protein